MFKLAVNDELLRAYHVDCFSYPSALFHIPFMGRFSNVQELARGLKTELETQYGDFDEVCLIGHSLGCVIIRQYIVTELKAGRSPLAHKLMLFAAPNTGAVLAKVGSKASWNHRHLKAICKNSDFLDILNEDWVQQQVENKCQVRWIIGGADAVVSADAIRQFGNDNVWTLLGRDHSNVVRPRSAEDSPYRTFRKFVVGDLSETRRPKSHSVRPADPLFDIMAPQDTIYYLTRPWDALLEQLMPAGHVWVDGASGVGKTTALRAHTYLAGWELHQIMLAGYRGRTPDGLFRALANEISELPGEPSNLPTPSADIGELISHIRRKLRALCDDGTATFLVEEIPLASGPELTDFSMHLLRLVDAVSSDPSLSGRIQFAFSSIGPLALLPTDGSGKFKERVQFITLPYWPQEDIRRLVDLFCGILGNDLSDSDRKKITEAANGVPRFVKMIFRRWRNGTAQEMSLDQLIASVAAEQI